jgi:hypothetical protein
VLQVTLLSSVQTVKNVRAQAELNKTKTQREPTKQTTMDDIDDNVSPCGEVVPSVELVFPVEL